jgi:uncharacterized DUF497 family protein
MEFEFDPEKNIQNHAKHGIAFEQIAYFDWRNCLTMQDLRWAYGETRFVSYGMVQERLHIVVWTVRNETTRLISFRKANKRERIFYEKKKNNAQS